MLCIKTYQRLLSSASLQMVLFFHIIRPNYYKCQTDILALASQSRGNLFLIHIHQMKHWVTSFYVHAYLYRHYAHMYNIYHSKYDNMYSLNEIILQDRNLACPKTALRFICYVAILMCVCNSWDSEFKSHKKCPLPWAETFLTCVAFECWTFSFWVLFQR